MAQRDYILSFALFLIVLLVYSKAVNEEITFQEFLRNLLELQLIKLSKILVLFAYYA